MDSKSKNKIAICGGIMTIALLTGMMLQQTADALQVNRATSAVAPQIRPVCDFVPKGEDVSPVASQTALVEPAFQTSTQVPTAEKVEPEPQTKPKITPEQPSISQPPQTPMPPTYPKMGDTRIINRQKQVYFLGFGWIEDNNTPNECVYVEDMYENGNKVGGMGGGTFVDGNSDINKMVGTMDAGETGRSCGDINK